MRVLSSLWRQWKHQLFLVLLPPIAVVGLVDSLEPLHLVPTGSDTLWWIGLPLIFTMLVLMPAAVRRLWPTAPLTAGAFRQSLDDTCRDRRCFVSDILIWHTGGTMANAAVVGIVPPLRYMLLTDVLINHLSEDQLTAVARHELAHLRRWHLPLRLAVLLLPVVGWLAIKHTWPGIESAMETTIAAIGLRPTLAAAFGVPMGLLLYTIVVVGWYSRLLEHDADLDACRDQHGSFDESVANELSCALLNICSGTRESRLMQWLHPPVDKRVDTMRLAILQPEKARAFQRRLDWMAATILALYLAVGLLATL